VSCEFVNYDHHRVVTTSGDLKSQNDAFAYVIGQNDPLTKDQIMLVVPV
jgi:hypothetical protein